MAKHTQVAALLFALLALVQPFVAIAASATNNGGAQNGNTSGANNNNAQSTNSNAGNNRGNGGGGGNGNGNSVGDPLIQAFDGTRFFFHGTPGKIYNLISMKDSFQVTGLLKEANNAVHIGSTKNGTYIEGLGFTIEDAKVVAKTFADDSSRIVVQLNGKDLDLTKEVKTSVPLLSGDSLAVSFVPFKTGEGSTLTLTTSVMTASCYLVPPGLDHASYWQPSYLNFNVVLNKAPAQPLQGVIGDTFHYKSDNKEASVIDTPEKDIPVAPYTDLVYPVFPDSAYEVASFFAAPRFAFPASFIHDIIATRKAVSARLAAPAAIS